MAFVEALKPKPGSKHLCTIIDADGREILAETRNDELQKIKYEAIIKLLIGAGYYRAKIKVLSEFDKVVGGMAWCIDICNVDLDVDLLFKENSTIGQKIALTEKIVAVLPKLECPYSIEPHQIQGLDFIHIHPVIEWLVKRSNENRDERGDYLRSFAIQQFCKNYSLPDENPDPDHVVRIMENIKYLEDKYGPQRKFRRIDQENTNRKHRIESTLFEYGHTPSQESDGIDVSKVEAVDLHDRTEEIAKTMMSISSDIRLGASTVSSLVADRVSEVSEVVQQFSQLQTEDSDIKRLNKLKSVEKKLENEKNDLEENLKMAEAKYSALMDTENLLSGSDRLPEDLKQMEYLESLIISNEALKEQESQFKNHCKEELASLKEWLREAETVKLEDDTEELEQVSKELSEARLRLAKVTRSVASTHRLVDQVPSRAELSQYQKRFLELYNQVAAKHRETKQYYSLYNSLNDQHLCLSKELNLLNSIMESYHEAMLSPVAKEEFMEQFKAIVDGIKQNKSKVEQKRNDERDCKEKLRLQLQSLIDQQRLYAAALKEFTAECKLNESLVVKLKSST